MSKPGKIDAEFGKADPRFAWIKGIDDQGGRRQPGLIEKAWQGKEDHGLWMLSIQIDFGGTCQGFAPVFSSKQTKDFKAFTKDVCGTFRVSTLDKIVGLRCYALRCFPGWNQTIEGLEDVDTGRRIVLTSWWRENIGPCDDPLTRAVSSLRQDAENAMRKVAAYEEELKELKSGYVDWSKP